MSEPSFCCLTFPSTPDVEEIQGVLAHFNPLGIHEEDTLWRCYFPTLSWISGLREECLATLSALFPSIIVEEETLKLENWNDDWERSIQPLRVSDRFIVAPSWSHVEAHENEIVLVIDPKMSFGTGYHATTRLMLRMLETLDLTGTLVLDVGTGTGILAIAAMKLGAQKAVGVDTDEWSVDNATENLGRNEPTCEVVFLYGSMEQVSGTYDLILSNITKNDNLALLNTYRDCLSPNGRIILSGFYAPDLEDMKTGLLQHGFELVDTQTEDEWIALTAKLV
jgi:ribosomal protein L11 methyltransferase